MQDKLNVSNNLTAIREKRGLSAAALAGMVGVTRQTIYAIEAGSYVPNTSVGLRLAQVLAVAVEDLFSLPKTSGGQRHSETVRLLPSLEELHRGQPVQLCEVDGHLVAASSTPPSWCLPSSDAVISGQTSLRSAVKVQLHEANASFRNRILCAGCDPAMAIVARHLRAAGFELVLLHTNSSQSLSLLKQGYVHVAGTHLRDEATGESNLVAINKLFPADAVEAISFAGQDEGLVVANGNPKRIAGVHDLSRKGVTFLNREPGAGSRFLFDTHLKQIQLDPRVSTDTIALLRGTWRLPGK